MKSVVASCASVEMASANMNEIHQNSHCSTRSLSDRQGCVAEKVTSLFSLTLVSNVGCHQKRGTAQNIARRSRNQIRNPNIEIRNKLE